MVLFFPCSLLFFVGALNFLVVESGKGNPSPTYLKSNHARMRTMTTNRGFRERNTGYNRQFRDNVKKGRDSNDASIQPNKDTFVELYVRRIGTGPWSYFQPLSAPIESIDDEKNAGINSLNILNSLSNGGIEAEEARLELDKWVALKVFGQAFGEPLVLNNARRTLKSFRKLKSKFFQFGYKVASSNDMYVSVLDRSMTQVVQPSRVDASLIPSPTPLDVRSLWHSMSSTIDTTDGKDSTPHSHATGKYEQLVDQIDTFLGQCIAQNASSLLVCCDGSALFSGTECKRASGGVVVAAVEEQPRAQKVLPPSSALMQTQQQQQEALDVTGDANRMVMREQGQEEEEDGGSASFFPAGLGDYANLAAVARNKLKESIVRNRVSTTTAVLSPNQFEHSDDGNGPNDDDDDDGPSAAHPSTSPPSISSGGDTCDAPTAIAFYLCLEQVAGAVATPFDAELVAGTAGCVLADLLTQRYHQMLAHSSATHQQQHHHQNQEQNQADARANKLYPADVRVLDIQILTDSRALCKLLRTPSVSEAAQRNEGETLLNEPSSSSSSSFKEDLLNRNFTNRAALWEIASQHTDHIGTCSSEAGGGNTHARGRGDCQISWTAGHPERRTGTNTETWTAKDKVAWVADTLARRCDATAAVIGNASAASATAVDQSSSSSDVMGMGLGVGREKAEEILQRSAIALALQKSDGLPLPIGATATTATGTGTGTISAKRKTSSSDSGDEGLNPTIGGEINDNNGNTAIIDGVAAPFQLTAAELLYASHHILSQYW